MGVSIKRVGSITAALAAVLALSIGLTMGLAGTANASIPDSNGVIHGCFAKTANQNTGNPVGSLRVIDSGLNQSCTANENSLLWNQQGPPGPQGPPGVSGYNIVGNTAGPDPTVALAQANCPSGQNVLGGGGTAQAGTPGDFAFITSSAPFNNHGVTGWSVESQNPPGSSASATAEATAFAICANTQ